MAEANVEFNYPQKFQDMKAEIIRVFDELHYYINFRRKVLLDRLDKIRRDYRKNTELTDAIHELRKMKEGFRSNLLVSSFGENFLSRIRGFEESKVETENFEFFGFRCDFEKIRRTITEIELFEISPEYEGREDPVLTACYQGDEEGELHTPRGVTFDKIRNEVYVCDRGNNRIQVLSTVGDYIRQFGNERLIEPYGICLSKRMELFVTDKAKESVMKFAITGEFLNQTGSGGTEVAQFTGISGLCCEPELVFVCDCGGHRVQIFDSELNYIKQFGSGELSFPTDISILSETIYVLSQNENCFYCYNMCCILEKKIELTGQHQLITGAYFFTIDNLENFLVSSVSLQQILIFSSKGVLRHILRTKNLPHGIVIDNYEKVICVCHSKECLLKF